MGVLPMVKTWMALIWLSGFSAGMSSNGPKAVVENEAKAPDLDGKILLFVSKKPDGLVCILEKVEMKRLGETSFFVGQVADLGARSSIAPGTTVWLAPENVLSMLEFDSIEAVKKAVNPKPASPPVLAPNRPGGWTADPSPPAEGPRLPPIALPPSSIVPPAPLPPAPAGSSSWLPVFIAPEAEADWKFANRLIELPLILKPDRLTNADKIRVYLSRDSGKNWQHLQDLKPTEYWIRYEAPTDGHYWFAIRIVSRTGRDDTDPEHDLQPEFKARVGSK